MHELNGQYVCLHSLINRLTFPHTESIQSFPWFASLFTRHIYTFFFSSLLLQTWGYSLKKERERESCKDNNLVLKLWVQDSLFSISILAQMKMFGFWVLLFLVVVWTIFMFPTLSTSLTTSTSISVIGMNTDMTVPICEDVVEAKSSIEEHKGKNYDPITEKKVNNEGNLNLEDYHQIDPAPYSRATIKFGPIEHGTPLMPYIPKPTPPYHPIHGVSPSP